MARIGLGLLGTVVLCGVSGCNRRKPAEVNDIVASVSVNRARAPLGSAVEVTYTWTVGPGYKKLNQDYRALVHFLDSHKVQLFTDDHVPVPAPTSWEAGKTYSADIEAIPKTEGKFVVFIKSVALPHTWDQAHYPQDGTLDQQKEFVGTYSVQVTKP